MEVRKSILRDVHLTWDRDKPLFQVPDIGVVRFEVLSLSSKKQALPKNMRGVGIRTSTNTDVTLNFAFAELPEELQELFTEHWLSLGGTVA